MEQTTVQAGPAVPQLEKPVALRSYLWEEMKEQFLKGQPKVLGVVQIMVGLMNLSMGIIIMYCMLSFYGPRPLSVYSGYSVWGSVMFVISGSFSTATAIRTTRGLLQASLGLNITSSVFAGVGMILITLSLAVTAYSPFNCYRGGEHCQMTASVLRGLDGVSLLLSVLEFCVAVSSSSFGCTATCCYPGGITLILPSNPHTTQTASPAPLGGGLTVPTDPEKSVPGNVF